MYTQVLILSALFGPTLGCLWDGSFNDYSSVHDFDKCTMQCGQAQTGSSGSVTATASVNVHVDVSYMWYIKGTQETEKYIDLSDKYKNPADTSCKQGAKLTVNQSSKYGDKGSLRTELVAHQKPQEKQKPMNKGKVAHHFSVKHSKENTPNKALSHQLYYFDSGLTEMRYGCGETDSSDCTGNNKLKWFVETELLWELEFVVEEWYNFIYEIDYDAKEVSLWHSKHGEELEKVAGPHPCSKCESNGKDWHVGVAVHPHGGKTLDTATPEDWYVSGCYVEDAATDLTTKPISKLS